MVEGCLSDWFSATNCLGDFWCLRCISEAVLAPRVRWKTLCGKVHAEAGRVCEDTGLGGSLGDSGSEFRDSSQPQAGAIAPGRPPWTIGLFNCANEKNNILFEEFGKDPAAITMFCCDEG